MSDVSNNNFDFQSVISALYVYPIKSCAGVQVHEAIMLNTGLEFDRAWMVVDAYGEFLTQRELPRMALIQPQLKQYEMVLCAPGMSALHIKLNAFEAPVRVYVWNDAVDAFDMGETAAQWFSDFLGTKARLVRFDPDHKRVCHLDWPVDVEVLNQFSDGFPVLVVSEASLEQLNSQLLAIGTPAASMLRFRPNVVLASSAAGNALAPHDEDRLDVLHISTGQGTVRLKPVKPCVRCPIPNIDPTTAMSSPQVGDTLQSYRADERASGAVTFGMNAVVLGGLKYTLKPGQQVAANYKFE